MQSEANSYFFGMWDYLPGKRPRPVKMRSNMLIIRPMTYKILSLTVSIVFHLVILFPGQSLQQYKLNTQNTRQIEKRLTLRITQTSRDIRPRLKKRKKASGQVANRPVTPKQENVLDDLKLQQERIQYYQSLAKHLQTVIENSDLAQGKRRMRHPIRMQFKIVVGQQGKFLGLEDLTKDEDAITENKARLILQYWQNLPNFRPFPKHWKEKKIEFLQEIALN